MPEKGKGFRRWRRQTVTSKVRARGYFGDFGKELARKGKDLAASKVLPPVFFFEEQPLEAVDFNLVLKPVATIQAQLLFA